MAVSYTGVQSFVVSSIVEGAPVMRIEDNPRYEFEAEEVALWLEQRGKNLYWTVDGDPKLGSVLSVPCPTDELVEQVRKIGEQLTVVDPREPTQPAGGGADRPTLDQLLEEDELGVPVLAMAWNASNNIFLLIEDEETSDSVNREASA